MWKPDALQAKSLEVDPEAEQNTASDLRLDAAVQIWDRWTIPMYLEVTLAGLQRTAN